MKRENLFIHIVTFVSVMLLILFTVKLIWLGPFVL